LAYVSTLRTTTSRKRVDLRLRIGTAIFPFRMRESDVFVLEEILLERQYELQTPVRPAPVIVDAGANIGVAALWFLAQNPGATLYAFEPEPENFELLSANIGNLNGVTVEQAALGAEQTVATLHLAAHGAMHSTRAGSGDEQRCVLVSSIRLGDYLKAHAIQRVDVLKIDVEGSEFDLLRGLDSHLDSVRVIVGELHEALVNEREFYEFLAARRFRCVRKQYYGSGRADRVHGFEAVRLEQVALEPDAREVGI
jgi:FkbM family methyltransferase